MQLDFFSKNEDIWNKVEGFEKEVFCYLNEYYADDEYVLSWTQEDLETFIYDFAENYMRWILKLELKSCPSNPDFEWLGDMDELERNHRLVARYEKELETLPKGSIIKRKIGNQEYSYLNYRNGERVISKFSASFCAVKSQKTTNIREIIAKL